MKVLLIDDDRDQMAVRALLLQQMGFNTVEASSNYEAVRTMQSESFDCAVVDLCLPTVEAGLEAVRDLRAHSSSIYIVVLTGFGRRTSQYASAHALADEVLIKGTGAAGLVERLKFLQQSRSLT